MKAARQRWRSKTRGPRAGRAPQIFVVGAFLFGIPERCSKLAGLPCMAEMWTQDWASDAVAVEDTWP